MKGHLAQRYGELVKDLWAGTSKSIAPLKFRVSCKNVFREILLILHQYLLQIIQFGYDNKRDQFKDGHDILITGKVI